MNKPENWKSKMKKTNKGMTQIRKTNKRKKQKIQNSNLQKN